MSFRVVSRRRQKDRRRRQLRQAGRFALTRVLPLILVIAVGAQLWPAASGWLGGLPFLEVKKIWVRGNRFLTPAEVLTIASLRPSMSLLSVRAPDSEAKLRLHPRIRHADVEYVFPRGLRVTLEERSPVALVELGQLAPLAADGVLLPPVEGRPIEDLPIILPPKTARVEGPIVRDSKVADALSLLAAVYETDSRLGESISIVDLRSPEASRVYLDTLSTGLVYETGRWREPVRALPAVIADLDTVVGAVLDFRFDREIVRRSGSAEAAAAFDSLLAEARSPAQP
jgi:cell division septal protein FtsQ